jgi:hypothetical protein
MFEIKKKPKNTSRKHIYTHTHTLSLCKILKEKMEKQPEKKKRKLSTQKKKKKVPSAVTDLWKKGKVLHGFKKAPNLILLDKKVPQGFHVKKFLAGDAKLEENASVELIRWFGFPDPPPRDSQVDLYYPELRLFFEIHEGQHLWPGHSIYSRIYSEAKKMPPVFGESPKNMPPVFGDSPMQKTFGDSPMQKTFGSWEQQRKGDVEKMKKFLEMGFYGAVILAVDGPFSSGESREEAIEKQPWLANVNDVEDITYRWTVVSPMEIRKRASLAAKALLSERAKNYSGGDYEGKIFLFLSPSTGTAAKTDENDGIQVGRRFLFFDQLRKHASSSSESFDASYIEALKKSHTLSLKFALHREDEGGIGLPIDSLDRTGSAIFPGGTILSRSKAQLIEKIGSLVIW